MASRHSGVAYRLNVRFLGFLVLGIVVVSVGAFFLHRYQKSRLVDRFIQQANLARDDGKPFEEMSYLQQYIGLNPTNAEARVRYGMVMAKNNRNGIQAREAYFALQKALQDDPNMADAVKVRVQCVKLALRPGLDIPPSDAIRELEILLKDSKDNPEYEEYYATALMRAGEYAKADSYLTKVNNRNPARFDSFVRLAWLKREKLRVPPKDAEFVISEMLRDSSNKLNPRAWVRASGYYKFYDEADAWGRMVAEARRLVSLDPNTSRDVQAEVSFAAAEYLLAKWRKSLEPGEKPKTNADFDEGIRLLGECIAKLKPLPPIDPLPEPGSTGLEKLEMAAQAYRMLSQAFTLAEQYGPAEKYAREQVATFPDTTQPLFLPLQVELLDVLVRQGKYADAEAICQKFSSRGFAPAIVELQRGFMDAQRKYWVSAARHLERTVTEMASNPELARRTRYMLAMCYDQTGELDRLAQILADAIPPNPYDPFWVSSKVAYAEVLSRLNRQQEAVAQLKEVVRQDAQGQAKDAPLRAKARVMLTQLMIAERAGSTNSGTANEGAMEAQLKSMPAGPDAESLKAQLLVSRKQYAEARTALDEAIAKYPEALELYAARIQIEVIQRQFPAAEAVLAKAVAKFGDTFGTRQMRIALVGVSAGGEAARAPDLEALAKDLEKFEPAQRVAMLKNLSFAARSIGRRDLARKWLDAAVAIKGEHDLDIHQMRFDLALLDGDEPGIQKVLDEIATIAGGKDNPTYKLPYAFSLLHKADRTTDPAERKRILEVCNDLLAGLEGTRKEWGRLDLARAKANDMLGRHEVAIESYRRAIDHGERRGDIVSRYIELCFLLKKGDRVQTVLRDHPQIRSMLGSEVDKVIQMFLEGGYLRDALEIAREAVPEESTDPVKLFWLARVQNTCGDASGAEVTLRKASKSAIANGNLWLAYVQILVKNKKAAEAKAFVEESQSKLTVPDAPLYIAQGWAAVGESAKANELFEKLLKEKPNDIGVNLAAGGFYFLANRFDLAAPIMEKILKHEQRTPQQEGMARRMLALCTVASKDHMSGVRALGILGYRTPDETTKFTGREELDDLRSRFAVISVIKGLNARSASLTLLREIDRRLKQDKLELSTDETLAMGQIQFSLGNMAEASHNLQKAALSQNGGAVSKAIYASFLLRSERLDEARAMIQQLVGVEPNSLRTAELQARHAVLEKRNSDAAAVMQKYAAQPDAKPELAAAVLDQLGLPDDAGPLYARAAESQKQPELRLLYAAYLARCGKAEEMLAEFERAIDSGKVPVELAVPMLCGAMLSVGPDKPAVISKVNQRLTALSEKNPGLLPYLAAFKSLVDEVPEAIAISRRILEKEPTNVFVLNNYAFMLAMKEGKYQDALAAIRKAIEVAGPQPLLLDTEAMILIASGSPKDALERLNEVFADEPSATAYMHQAQANLALGRREAAQNSVRDAKKYNLKIEEFHPLERRILAAVLAQLGG